MSMHTHDEDNEPAPVYSDKGKRLQAYARTLRAEGASEEAIRAEVDALEAEIDAEPQPVDTTGKSPQEIAAINIERASSGLPELPSTHLIAVTDKDGKRKYVEPTEHKLSSQELAGRKLERAIRGNDAPFSARVAPKGMSERQRQAINLERACNGEAPLLPYGSSEE